MDKDTIFITMRFIQLQPAVFYNSEYQCFEKDPQLKVGIKHLNVWHRQQPPARQTEGISPVLRAFYSN
jgi:hypothetical protein